MCPPSNEGAQEGTAKVEVLGKGDEKRRLIQGRDGGGMTAMFTLDLSNQKGGPQPPALLDVKGWFVVAEFRALPDSARFPELIQGVHASNPGALPDHFY